MVRLKSDKASTAAIANSCILTLTFGCDTLVGTSAATSLP